MTKFNTLTTGKPYFTTNPVAGHTHVYKDQIYTYIGDAVKNGYQVIGWQSNCADCGQPFTMFVSARSSVLNRRCEEHSRAGIRVAADAVHPAAQGWPAAPTKNRKAAPSPAAAPAPALTPSGKPSKEHPRYGEWLKQNLETEGAARKTFPPFDVWLERENLSQFD